MESREKALKDEAVEVVEAAIKRHEDFDKAIKAQVRTSWGVFFVIKHRLDLTFPGR